MDTVNYTAVCSLTCFCVCKVLELTHDTNSESAVVEPVACEVWALGLERHGCVCVYVLEFSIQLPWVFQPGKYLLWFFCFSLVE